TRNAGVPKSLMVQHASPTTIAAASVAANRSSQCQVKLHTTALTSDNTTTQTANPTFAHLDSSAKGPVRIVVVITAAVVITRRSCPSEKRHLRVSTCRRQYKSRKTQRANTRSAASKPYRL